MEPRDRLAGGPALKFTTGPRDYRKLQKKADYAPSVGHFSEVAYTPPNHIERWRRGTRPKGGEGREKRLGPRLRGRESDERMTSDVPAKRSMQPAGTGQATLLLRKLGEQRFLSLVAALRYAWDSIGADQERQSNASADGQPQTTPAKSQVCPRRKKGAGKGANQGTTSSAKEKTEKHAHTQNIRKEFYPNEYNNVSSQKA